MSGEAGASVLPSAVAQFPVRLHSRLRRIAVDARAGIRVSAQVHPASGHDPDPVDGRVEIETRFAQVARAGRHRDRHPDRRRLPAVGIDPQQACAIRQRVQLPSRDTVVDARDRFTRSQAQQRLAGENSLWLTGIEGHEAAGCRDREDVLGPKRTRCLDRGRAAGKGRDGKRGRRHGKHRDRRRGRSCGGHRQRERASLRGRQGGLGHREVLKRVGHLKHLRGGQPSQAISAPASVDRDLPATRRVVAWR